MRGRIVGQRYWIGVVFFLLAAAPGFWLPVLSNVLKAKGWGGLTTWAFLIPHLAGIISPILLGARADNKYRADRILASLAKFDLPLTLTDDIADEAILEALARDKKFEAGSIRFVIVETLGDARVTSEVTMDDIREAIGSLRS